MNDSLDVTDTPDITELETNTAKLWLGGARTVPEFANKYAVMSHSVESAGDDMPEFKSQVASAEMYEVRKEWKALKYQTQLVMAKSATNLHDVGKALVMFSEHIDGIDTKASNEIKDLKKDIGDDFVNVVKPSVPNL